MTPEEGKRLLEGEGIPYGELCYESDGEYWADVLPWTPTRTGQERPVTVLRIEAPNGRRHLDLLFCDGEFEDLCFGGFAFELWDSKNLRDDLLHHIRQVREGRSYCNVWVNVKNQKWAGDGYFSEEEGDISLREELGWRYAPKPREERRVRIREELYSWTEYHQFER